VVDVGETDTVEVFPPPAFALQVKVLAPLALSIELCPEHIEAGVAVTVSDGKGVTLTVTVAVSLQPLAVPTNVYVAVTVGDTLIEGAFDVVLHV
jgi:hypothetical protein